MLTRSKVVADRVREMILRGEHPPGTHLQEVPLAESMSVSRTPVRAALQALEKEGLLSYVAKRGFEVRRFASEDIVDMYKVRAALEGHAASECALRPVTPAFRGELEAALATGDAILAGGRLDPADLPAYREMNHRFHEAIIQQSGSRATMTFVSQMRQIPMLSDRVILWHDFRLIDRSHDDHHRVFDAIRNGDAARAGAIMREHVYFMGTVVQAEMSRGALVPPAEDEA